MADFSEAQWRACFAVERFTDMDIRYFEFIRPVKPVLGGTFGWGNFWVGKVTIGRPEHFGRIDYHVIERGARLIVGHAHASAVDAISEARVFLQAMGEDLAQKLIRERMARDVPPASLARRRESKPRKISKRAQAIFDSSNGKCHYCKTALVLDGKWHIEHKVPRALFGGSEQANLAASCVPCNMAKRDKTDLEFQGWLADKGLVGRNADLAKPFQG